ncbi:MAG: Exodeoxyribonuclease III [Alphaproteobacteria bacterium MarineAlpha9_Bin4]|nr:exodeoxyribonuclease III [Pelagibacterales bacterium]PPR26576.1 MAG: Exodeoxyribonuclease III [Alphaproteobacteria bacterium MarineAlpha9_Bin4]
MNNIKVASWNVNSVRARIDLLINWIKENKPDVLLLQELKAREEDFPYDAFDSFNYNIKVNGQKSYNGVAILSKFPCSDIEINLPTFQDTQSRYIEAWIDCQDSGFRVASVYAPNGNPINTDKFNYKLQWLNSFYKHAKNLLENEEKIILAGDYNICPSKKDVANENMILGDAIYQAESKNLYRKICNIGFFDAFRELNDNLNGFTYWDYGQAYQNNLGVRIDHFLLSSYALDTLESTYVDEIPRKQKKTSDHAPIIANFRF